MKTLIFNGSPREKGDTAFLINRLKERLDGEVMTVDAYRSAIKPCSDCRACQKTPGCAIKDDMQAVYEFIRECDAIVIASPLYFSELTGPLLAIASRLQTLYASKRFLGARPVEKKKRGAVILCGGGDGAPDRAIGTAKTLLKLMNAELVATICSLNTDRVPADKDERAMNQTDELAKTLMSCP